MGYQFTYNMGSPNLEAYVEKGKIEQRQYQDELNLKKNQQALSLRQIIANEQAQKEANRVAQKRLELEARESALAEKTSQLDMLYKQKQIESFETPAQKREAESLVRQKEAKFATEEAVRGKGLLRDYVMSTPEGRAAAEAAIAESFKTIQDAKRTGKQVTASDLTSYYNTVRKYDNDISLAIEAKDREGAMRLETEKNKYMDDFNAIRSGNVPQGMTYEQFKSGMTEAAKTYAQDTPLALFQSVSSLSAKERGIVELIKTEKDANDAFTKAASPKLKRAIGQKVAVYQKYLEDAESDLIDAKSELKLVSSVADKKHPRYRSADSKVKMAEDRVRQIRESSLAVVEKLIRREAGVDSLELLFTTSVIENAKRREMEEREYAERLRRVSATSAERGYLTGDVLPPKQPSPPTNIESIDWLTGQPRR